MKIQEIHKKLDKQCPIDYKINEIIRFAYPYRRVRVKATVSKSPEKSIQQIYSVFLRTIKAGYTKDDTIIEFLGLNKEDFILRELYSLREKGFIILNENNWSVTIQGESFIEDNSILKILEEEEFEFLIDTITNEALAKNFKTSEAEETKRLAPKVDYPNRDSSLLDNKNEQLSDIYKAQSNGKVYLVDYDKSNITFDSVNKEFKEYYLIEYISRIESENEIESFIEIRNTDKEFSKEKRITGILSDNYFELIKEFSDSERTNIIQLKEESNQEVLEKFEAVQIQEKVIQTQTLAIWETQEKFEEAIKTATSKLLIESPWIKRATLKYINILEKALKRNVIIVVLYGIDSKDEHDRRAEKEMERLEREYRNFHLIHLPTHFARKRNHKMTGTHRKLVIKDNEYYIQGSFNFLSFNKERDEKIANEESILLFKDVQSKWESVLREYQINRRIIE